MSKNNTPKKNSNGIHQVADPHARLTEEIMDQASQTNQAEGQLATDKIEQQKNSFINRFKSWLSAQIDRVSNTIIALLVASLMTIAMPYLVKLEMDNEFNSLSSSLGGLVSSKVSEHMNLASSNLATQNSQMLNSIVTIEANLKELESKTNNDQYPFLAAQLNNLQISQQNNHAMISTLIDDMKKPGTVKNRSNRAIISKIDNYFKAGTRLLENRASEANIKNWIEEVYYFVSMMKLEQMDLSIIKESLNNVYQLDKPLVSKDQRIQKTLIILGVMNDWLSLAKS